MSRAVKSDADAPAPTDAAVVAPPAGPPSWRAQPSALVATTSALIANPRSVLFT
jgi:hypothetical protein